MFNSFKVKKPQRSTFSLSHKHESTVNIGDINCLHWNWCFPGDRFKIKYSFLCKFAPMIAPNFSRMRLKSEVFYVPLADLYDHFHDTIMNYKEESSEVRENGNVTTLSFTKLPSMPIDRFALHFENLPSGGYTVGDDFYENLKNHTPLQEFAIERLIHQIGVPFDICRKTIGTVNNPYCENTAYLDHVIETESTSEVRFNPQGNVLVSLFPFQAYQYVYNWYYRDSVRSPEIDCFSDVTKSSDYVSRYLLGDSSTRTIQSIYDGGYTSEINFFFNSLFQVRRRFYRKDYFNTAVGDPTVGVDSISVPDNIVDLRKANQLQKFIEKQALAGNRIAEFIMAHWAHKADNYELGRPILISSSSQNVQISEVLQTSQTTEGADASAQGTRSGVGNSYGSSNGSYFVSPDYGILLINMSIVPEISYFSGIPRKLTPYRWEHFPWPEFAQIGMQPIYDFELSNSFHNDAYQTWGTEPVLLEDQNVFGYAPRYSEYKMELDQVSGEMATSLRFWHQSPHLVMKQNLNQSFGLIGMVDYNMTPYYSQEQYYNQIFAVSTDYYTDHCQVIGMFDISVNRALPYNDMPAL